MRKYILTNGKILTPFEMINDYILEIEGNKISNIFKSEDLNRIYFDKNYDKVLNLKGKIISPGFIDIHNHGAMGVDFNNFNEISAVTEYLASNGTTSILITLGNPPLEKIKSNLEAIKKTIIRGYKGTRIAGINLEGPYLNPKHGVQRDNILSPVKKEYEEIINKSLPYLKIMTVAPELENARELIKYLNENNIIISIGHSEASRDDIDFAILHGAKLITHIFDAFGPPIQKRKGIKAIGIEEYLLSKEDLFAEVVADKIGIHVDPLFLRFLLNIKGKYKIILITDSIYTAGLNFKEYKGVGGITLKIKDDININKENNDVYGSILTLNKAIKNIMSHTGISIKDAILMATYNPANLLGIDDRKGSIKVGMDADLTVIDEALNVYMTIIEGNIFYDNSKKFSS